VEKPCSHNVFEGRKCVEAARKYKRMVQHGTHSAEQHGGPAGCPRQERNLRQASCQQRLLLQAPLEHRLQPVEDPPPTLNFDIWLGPAPSSPFTRISCITTGIGFGISATATSATRGARDGRSTMDAWRKLPKSVPQPGGPLRGRP